MTKGPGIPWIGSGWRLGACLAVLILTSAGCSDKNAVPSGILPRQKMQDVLWDMVQADQYALLFVAKDSAHIDKKMETLRLYEQVFRLHQVSREEFNKSYRYYLEHPQMNKDLFDSLINRAGQLRTESYSHSVPYHPPPPAAPPGQPNVSLNPSHMPLQPGSVPAAHTNLPASIFRFRDSMARAHQAAIIRARDSIARLHGVPPAGVKDIKKDTGKKRS